MDSLGYSASDVDGIYLDKVPHLVIRPIQLHTPTAELQQALGTWSYTCHCPPSKQLYKPQLGVPSKQGLYLRRSAVCLLAEARLLLVHRQLHCPVEPAWQHARQSYWAIKAN